MVSVANSAAYTAANCFSVKEYSTSAAFHSWDQEPKDWRSHSDCCHKPHPKPPCVTCTSSSQGSAGYFLLGRLAQPNGPLDAQDRPFWVTPPGVWTDKLGLHWALVCGPQELHSCSTSVRHQGGCQLLALPLHFVRSLGRCFCDSGDSVAAGAAVIFRGLSDRYHASLSPPPPRLSGPLPISELSGCQRLLAYLVPASACSHTASQVTPPALTAPTAAPPSGTLLQSSLQALSLDPQAQQPTLLADSDPCLF